MIFKLYKIDRLSADLLVSTLQSYIVAMGGELSLIVEFKDRPPVKIAGLASILEPKDIRNGEEDF